MEYYCIEGEMLELKCSVYADNICVEWFKNISKRYGMDTIKTNNNILIDNEGKDHVLTIKNAKVTDSGKYTIIAGHDRQQLTVTVAGKQKQKKINITHLAVHAVIFLSECRQDVLQINTIQPLTFSEYEILIINP